MRSGCIGLAHIGHHLAADLLAAGHVVAVHDLDRGAADELVAVGAAEYATVGKLLEEACGTDLRAPGFPETLEEYLATMPRATPEVAT